MHNNIQSSQYDRAVQFINSSKGGKVLAKAGDNGVMDMDIYGDIGFMGVTSDLVRGALSQAGDVNLRINSRGGDAGEGIAIYNDLVNHAGKVNVVVSGYALSAASIIAMAGDTISIYETAHLMIHNAWGIGIGDKHDIRSLADLLESHDAALARVYANRTKIGIRSITEKMDSETWMRGKKAVEDGFADRVIPSGETSAQAKWDLRPFANVPQELLNEPEEDDKDRPIEWVAEKALRDVGHSAKRAKEIVATLKSGGLRDVDQKQPSPQRDVEDMGDAIQTLIFNLNVTTASRRFL